MLSGICGGRVCSPSCLRKKYCAIGRCWMPWSNFCSVLPIGKPCYAACRRSGACCGCCTSQLPLCNCILSVPPDASQGSGYLLFSLDPCSTYNYNIPIRFTSPRDLSDGACISPSGLLVKADLLVQAKVPERAAEEKKQI